MTKEADLLAILSGMDVPKFRLTNVNGGPDLHWLRRNLGINNRDHPQFELAEVLVRAMLADAKEPT